jgi:hypothetical protein
MSVLRAAALEGLARAVRRGRVVVHNDPVVLDRARARGKLVIDARAVASAVARPGGEFSGRHPIYKSTPFSDNTA